MARSPGDDVDELIHHQAMDTCAESSALNAMVISMVWPISVAGCPSMAGSSFLMVASDRPTHQPVTFVDVRPKALVPFLLLRSVVALGQPRHGSNLTPELADRLGRVAHDHLALGNIPHDTRLGRNLCAIPDVYVIGQPALAADDHAVANVTTA